MRPFVKDLIRAFFIGVIIFIFGYFINYFNGYSPVSVKEFLLAFAYTQLYSIILFFINAHYFRFLLKVFRGKLFTLKNLTIGAIGGVLLTIAAIFLIRFLIVTLIEGETVGKFLNDEQPAAYGLYILMSIIISAVFYIIYYYKNVYDRKITQHKIVAGTASAKFESLKNQLDPHFLFNSLNVLTSLIEENPENATEFTTSLSKVYRYVLEQKNKTLVTVREELEFARLYMSLLSMRFEDSLVFSFPDELENPEAQVVPLSLQLLLENAVKHNQLTPQKQLHIKIYEKNGMFWVSNNLQPKKVFSSGTGVGLENIRNRYGLISNEKPIVEKDSSHFKVGLPLIAPDANPEIIHENYLGEKRYEDAKKKVQELKAFYIHLAVYLLAVPGFIYLNIISTPGFPWALFPIFGWGFGITGHGMEAFGYHPLLNKQWEEKRIREYISRQQTEHQREVSYRNARKYVKKLKDFYTTCFFSMIMIPFLAALNYYLDGFKYPWIIYPILGWGLAIAIQAFSLFPSLAPFSKNWEERQMKKFMKDENDNHFKD